MPLTAALYLVPTPLDFGETDQLPLGDCLPDRTLTVASGLSHWICENAKSARAFLKRVNLTHPLAVPLQQQVLHELPKAVHKRQAQAQAFDARPWLAPLASGIPMGLLSEAGMPAVADPGESVVAAAHELGLPVAPLVGPVSLMLALAASGLNGQSFAFVGYVPQDTAARAARIAQLEQTMERTGQTQLLIETPYRNATLWAALTQLLKPGTRLGVACGLTLGQERVQTRTVQQWRQSPPPDLPFPALFMLGR